jgi:hypothetical protein
MKTLVEYNQEKQLVNKMVGPQRNDIECPNCKTELLDKNDGLLLMTSPPKKNIFCENCGYTGYRIA